MIGKTIDRYKIIDKLGEGGMGEVWLAEDTRLERKVALKFLPKALQTTDTARIRFMREAKSAAALDHPYICHIHEVGESDVGSFIAMEYIQGVTLRDIMNRGPIPVREALKITMEIAEALERAHEEGIIHRDLKPSNVMQTPDGHIKVLDFGLAKRLDRGQAGEESVVSLDLSASLTIEGTTLGTLAYMAPEQLRGQPADRGSDIFALGVLLHEMIGGAHPFRKDSPMETASAILSDPATPLVIPGGQLPSCLTAIFDRLLAKDPDQRLASVKDCRSELSQCLEQTNSVRVPSVGPNRRWSYWYLSAAALIVIIGIAGALLLSRNRKPGSMGVTGGQVSRFLSIEYQIWDHDWSPDGKRIVFHELRADNRVDLWLCDASGSGLRNLTGHLEGRYGRPTWSPDSELITFAAMLNSTYGVFTMEISSGEIHKVTDLQVWNYCFPMWSRTDRIVYSDRLPNGQVHAFSVAPNGGNKRCLTLGLKVQGVVWPSLSPSGEFLLFRENWGSDSRPMLLHLSTGQLSELSQAGKYPQWHPSGRYIYIGTADGEFRNLWRTEIHPETGREMSEPEMIEATRNMNVTRYAFSPDGDRILFSTMLQQGDLWLFPTDTAGIMDLTSGQQLTQDDYHDSSPDFLDESDSVLFHSNRGQAGALWTLNLKDAAAPTSFPLPGGFEACWGPSVIPPDGTWFAFHHSDQHLPEQPYLMRPDGSEIHPLGSSIGDVFDSLSVEHITLRDCSADGRRMVFDFYRGGSEMEMALGSFDPETGLLRYFEPILGVDGQDPRFSPDGQAIAYESDRLGSYDVWTMRIDPPGIPEPVTYSGDRERIVGWSEDPSFIYYVIPQDVEFGLRSSVWRVPMDSDNKPSGEPELWQVFPMYMHIAGIDFYEDTAVLSITSRETAFWLLEFN